MTLRLCLILCLVVGASAQASVPLEASLRDLACGADHVFVGRVVGVDMIDAKGRSISDERAMTGPGESTTIRLELEVMELIESSEAAFPSSIRVPLDPFMHYSLGQIKAAHVEPSNARLVFLRGDKFQPVIAGRFFWGLDARDEALALRKECRP